MVEGDRVLEGVLGDWVNMGYWGDFKYLSHVGGSGR